MRKLTETEVDAAARMLVDHMREQLKQHGMDASPEAVREACRRRLRARLAAQALAAEA